MHGDWLVAFATIVAAIIGVLGGYFLARYQREKKILRFVVMDPEDLAASLRVHGNFEIRFADFITTELMLSAVTVRNLGNSSIKNIEFTVKIPGEHHFAQVNRSGKWPGMPTQVEVAVSQPAEAALDPIFQMSIPFLNAGEFVRINALYTGQSAQCEVTCRLPDTTVEVHTLPELYRIEERRSRWKLLFMLLAAFGTSIVFTLALYLFKQLVLGHP
jgi:hypothetical protein